MRFAILISCLLWIALFWVAQNAQARRAHYSQPRWFYVCPDLPDGTQDPHRANCVLEWRR